MESPFPFPEEVIESLLKSPARAFSHDVVMDAIDVSMALDRHLLLYGISGLFQLDTEEATWRLPPSRAAWIPAGSLVTASTIKSVRCISILLTTDFAASPTAGCQIFSATLLIREMIKHSLRWSGDREPGDLSADRFFLTLMDLCHEQMQVSNLFTIPKAKSDEVEEILQFISDNLSADLNLEDAAKLVSVSPRTLRRHLQAEIHMTWGQYLKQSRMLKAMDYLAKGMTVTETALEVGYGNISAFSTAFSSFTDLTPTQYRSQFE
ncbi:MAG: AraC family transcriptional regulator [Chloroflexota bacterium]